MAKRIKGYVRTTPGGDPIGSIPVTIRNKNTGLAIPVGGMIGASTNPVNTSPDGSFTWTSELSPGPVYAEAEVSITETKVRDGSEVMQAGDIFISDMEELFLIFEDGVISSVYNDLLATASVVNRDITIQPGRAALTGRLWGIDTNRILTAPANSTLAGSRWDYIVLRQYIGGTEKGRQDLVLVTGTISATDPIINTDPNIYEFPIWRVITPQNSATSILSDMRVFATSFINNNTITAAKMNSGGYLSNSEFAFMLKAPLSGATPAWSGINIGELNDVSASAPTTGNLLRWSGSAWVPSNLLPSHTHTESEVTNLVADLAAKAAVSHVHSQADITNLVADLAAKANSNNAVFTGTMTVPNGALAIDDTSGLQTALDARALKAGATFTGLLEGSNGFVHTGGGWGFNGNTVSGKQADPANVSTGTVDATWGTTEADVLNDLRSSFNTLVQTLRDIGMLTA